MVAPSPRAVWPSYAVLPSGRVTSTARGMSKQVKTCIGFPSTAPRQLFDNCIAATRTSTLNVVNAAR